MSSPRADHTALFVGGFYVAVILLSLSPVQVGTVFVLAAGFAVVSIFMHFQRPWP